MVKEKRCKRSVSSWEPCKWGYNRWIRDALGACIDAFMQRKMRGINSDLGNSKVQYRY